MKDTRTLHNSLARAIRKAAGKSLSKGEAALEQQLKAEKIMFAREVKFHPVRQWRFDFTFLKESGGFGFDSYVACEVEGGSWSNGAHNRGKHFAQDCIKYAEAAILGWRVLRFTTEQVLDGTAINYIKLALNSPPSAL